MTPGQLVYDTRTALVVEVTSQASERLYWVRPLGRRYISTLMRARELWLREVRHEPGGTWEKAAAGTGWHPTTRTTK
jgi:hypothetical protein